MRSCYSVVLQCIDMIYPRFYLIQKTKKNEMHSPTTYALGPGCNSCVGLLMIPLQGAAFCWCSWVLNVSLCKVMPSGEVAEY